MAALAGIGIAAMTGQAVWLRGQLHGIEPAGTRVDIGGRKIHLSCSGNGRRHFVFEAGALGTAENWTWLKAALGKDGRVCAYDRAGLGASDARPGGFVPHGVSSDLKAALDAAGEHGPFILVGHSLGGIFVREFAATYPDHVQALVLVDPSHEDQLARLPPERVADFNRFRAMVGALSVLARTGLLHVWNPLTAYVAGLDGAPRRRAELYLEDPKHLTAASRELQAWDAIMAHLRDGPTAPVVPILVVTAGAAGSATAAALRDHRASLHRDLAGRSPSGAHEILPDADHFSILTDRATAQRLAGRIRAFLARVEPPEPVRR